MKNKIQFLLGFSVIIILIALSAVHAAELKNTNVDYIPYREIVPGEAGVIYKIKLTNTGTASKTYYFEPNTTAVKNIGTYRIDPSDTITIPAKTDTTVYFYLALDKAEASRIEIPVSITSGAEKTELILSARAIAQSENFRQPNWFSQAVLNMLYSILIAIIIIVLLIALFRRIKKKDEGNGEKKKEGEEGEVETYY